MEMEKSMGEWKQNSNDTDVIDRGPIAFEDGCAFQWFQLYRFWFVLNVETGSELGPVFFILGIDCYFLTLWLVVPMIRLGYAGKLNQDGIKNGWKESRDWTVENGRKREKNRRKIHTFTGFYWVFFAERKNSENRYEKKISILILRNRVPLGFAKFGILEPIRELNMANRWYEQNGIKMISN